jgi:hypothetical protein
MSEPNFSPIVWLLFTFEIPGILRIALPLVLRVSRIRAQRSRAARQ